MATPIAARPPAVPKTIDRFFQFSLLGMLAAGYFAIVSSGYLDWPTASLTLLGLCLRALMVAGVLEIRFSNRFVALVTLIYTLFWPLDYFFVSQSFFTATVHLICFLAVTKVLTAASKRDYAYLKMIATMELLIAAVLSISLGFFIYLALFLLFAIAAFSSGEVRRSAQHQQVSNAGNVARGGLRAFSRRLSLLSMSLFTGILIMTAGMFFVLPRTARAALERFVPQRYHLPGFSGGITLGQLGEIKKSSVPVMHIKSENEGLLEVRWRGSTLSHFDGRRWSNPPPHHEIPLQVDHGSLMMNSDAYYIAASKPGRKIGYTVRLSDAASDTLFFAGTPGVVSIPNVPLVRWAPASESYHITPPGRGEKVIYGVNGFLEDESAERETNSQTLHDRARYLELPDSLDPRIPRLARRMSAGASSDIERARKIENALRREYGYTLELLPKEVPDPLATFLFDRKKGHCEYFASAMAVMLRSIGIPSRIVIGFQSGVYNPLTKSQIVRASDAHSWVEGWIAGRGWTTFDPTPPDPSAFATGPLARLSLFFDTAEQFWQDWVVSYDLEHQVILAARMDESARRLHIGTFSDASRWIEQTSSRLMRYASIAVVAAGTALILILFGPSIAAWYRARQRVRRLERGEGLASDATLLYERMLAVLARRGIQKPPWLTPAEFARVVPATEIGPVVRDLTSFYNEFRFGGRREVAPQMMQLLDRLEKI